MTQRTLLILVLVALLGGAGWFLHGRLGAATSGDGESPDTPGARLLPVQTVIVEPAGSYALRQDYTGTLEARRRGRIGFERAGRVDALLVDEGDSIEADQPLARLDQARLLHERASLVAQLAEARAVQAELVAGPRAETLAAARARVKDFEEQTKLLVKQHERRTKLHDEGVIPAEERDTFAAGLASAEARLDVARKELEELEAGTRQERLDAQAARVAWLEAQAAQVELEVERSELLAPYSGVVLARQADEGEVLAAGQPLFEIMELGSWEARVGVPSDLAAEIREGDAVELMVGEARFPATLRDQLPDLDPRTRTRTLIFALEEGADATLVPGEIVRLALERERATEGSWIPTEALVRGRRGLWSAFVLDETETTRAAEGIPVRRVELELLHVEAERVLVRGTLVSGQRVVLGGDLRLVPGQRVAADRD